MFKVVTDQLRISDGWVRCGQCGTVFDGVVHLQPDADAPVTPTATATPTATPTEVLAAPTAAAQEDSAPPTVHFDEQMLIAQVGGDQPVPVPSPRATEPAFAEPAFAQPEPAIPAVQEEQRTEPTMSAFTLSGATELLASEAEPVAQAQEEVSFLRQAPADSLWKRPAVRWALGGAGLALALSLLLQVSYHERDWLAAMLPGVRPWAQALCDRVGCRIGPLKTIEAISVESSSFNRIRGDAYRLQVVVKSSARTELAVPAIELTLTDTQDAAVMRRVLLPSDFPSQVATIGPGAEWSGLLTVSVSGAALAARVAGYRVLAFYP